MKLNSNFKIFAGVQFDASKYIASPAYGVNRFMLDRIGTEKARATTIVQYQPDSKFPEHEHIGGEEFLVLEGTFKDKFGEFPKGTYVRNPISSKHAPWVDGDGCTIMVKLLQMAETGEGIKSLHINTAESKANGATTEFGTILELYCNETTGERVQMCWVKPGSHLERHRYADDGEELFVFDGSLEMNSKETYPKWGWLRFPAGPADDQRLSVKAGIDGATVYRKTGHLTDKALAMEHIQIKED